MGSFYRCAVLNSGMFLDRRLLPDATKIWLISKHQKSVGHVLPVLLLNVL